MRSFRKALVLGGTGLVGLAICRKLASEGIKELVMVGLEDKEAGSLLTKEFPKIKIALELGNIFAPFNLKNKSFHEISENQADKELLTEFLTGPLTIDKVKGSFFYYLVKKYQPEIIIDSINSATQLSYTSFFKNHNPLLALTRFIQIFYQTIIATSSSFKVHYYVRIGTTGTGGMGLNIPYTHGELQPSQKLLLKSAVAGASTQLLFLLSRTPNMPNICEIKPATAIAWGEISFGPIENGKDKLFRDRGKRIVDLNRSIKKVFDDDFSLRSSSLIQAAFVDSGENGLFSLEEFRTITTLHQMEFITPEEIAHIVWLEITGKKTGFDIVGSLENSVLGASYEAGLKRHEVIEKLEELNKIHNVPSIAFELLGPPKLSKLLFEGYLLLSAFQDHSNLIKNQVKNLSKKIENFINRDNSLLLTILSTGIPILLSDGETLYRGSVVKVKPQNKNSIDSAANEGWIDLRSKNVRLWQNRIKKYKNLYPESKLLPGTLVAFIFEHEFGGYREK